MGFLKDAYEAVRKVILPTPEERAQQERALQIDDLELQYEYAKLGFKPSDAPVSYGVDPLYGGFIVPLAPAFDQADWSAEEKAQVVSDLAKRLTDLGVTGERLDYLDIQGLPARHVILNYKKDNDSPGIAI